MSRIPHEDLGGNCQYAAATAEQLKALPVRKLASTHSRKNVAVGWLTVTAVHSSDSAPAIAPTLKEASLFALDS